MITTIGAHHARALTPQQMTDEQLATADDLIRETMTYLSEQRDRDAMIVLFRQQCAINREAKERMGRAWARYRGRK